MGSSSTVGVEIFLAKRLQENHRGVAANQFLLLKDLVVLRMDTEARGGWIDDIRRATGATPNPSSD